MEILVLLIVLVAIVALIGHGLWVLGAWILRAIFGGPADRGRTDDVSTLCQRCLSPKPSASAVCETCVASVSSRPQQQAIIALTAVQNQIDRLRALGVLDSATYERFAQTIAAERQELTLRTDAQRSATDSPSAIPEATTIEQDALPVAEIVEPIDFPSRPSEPSKSSQPTDGTAAEPRDRSERIRELAAKFRTPPTDEAATGSVVLSSALPAAAGESLTVKSSLQTVPSQPRVAVSKFLASFMEEHSIRWGEIVGGLQRRFHGQ